MDDRYRSAVLDLFFGGGQYGASVVISWFGTGALGCEDNGGQEQEGQGGEKQIAVLEYTDAQNMPPALGLVADAITKQICSKVVGLIVFVAQLGGIAKGGIIHASGKGSDYSHGNVRTSKTSLQFQKRWRSNEAGRLMLPWKTP